MQITRCDPPVTNLPEKPATFYTIQGVPVRTGSNSELDFGHEARLDNSIVAISFNDENQTTVIEMPGGAKLQVGHDGGNQLAIPQ